MGSPWRTHGEFVWPNPHGKLMVFFHEIFMGYFCKGRLALLPNLYARNAVVTLFEQSETVSRSFLTENMGVTVLKTFAAVRAVTLRFRSTIHRSLNQLTASREHRPS